MTIPLRYDQLTPARQSIVQANVAKMRSMDAPDHDIESYLTEHEHLVPLGDPRGASAVHEEFKSGRMAKRVARENQNDADALAAEPGYGERLATHVLNTATGIPGVAAVEAGAGALGSKVAAKFGLIDAPLSYDASRAALHENTDQIGGKTAKVERVVGATAAAPFLPGGVVAGGAAYGAADAALNDDRHESLKDRAIDTAVGAGSGAATGVLLRGAGALAQRTGLTDLASRGLRKFAEVFGKSKAGAVAGDVAEAIGTKGALNDVLADRQAILDKLPASSKPAAEAVLEHSQRYRAQAAKDYDLARQDVTPTTDPRVQTIVQDPLVQRAYDWAQKVYEAGGGKIPQQVLQPAVPAGTQKLLPSVSGYTPTSLVPATNAAQPAQVMDLPNPEILALTKRHLQQFVEDGMSIPGIKREEAAVVLPKLDALRDALHDISPAWKTADAHFAAAKNFEEAFDAAYKAKSGPAGVTSDPAKLKTQPAIADWAGRGVNAPERAAGQQAGTAQRLAEQLRAAPIGSNIGETVRAAGPLFEPSQSAAAYRAPAFTNDADRQAFAQMLAHGGEDGGFDINVKTPVGKVGVGLPEWITRSPLETTAGTAARSEAAARLASPTEAPRVLAEIEAARRGAPIVAAAGKGVAAPAALTGAELADALRGRRKR